MIYLGTLGIIACLGFTAFAAVLRLGAIGGWWLFAHMCGAGALVAALPVLALMWADSNRLQIGPAGSGPAEPVQFLAIAKVAYWTILASGLVVAGTMVVSMLPWLGTPGQQLMLDAPLRGAGLRRPRGCTCMALRRCGGCPRDAAAAYAARLATPGVWEVKTGLFLVWPFLFHGCLLVALKTSAGR